MDKNLLKVARNAIREELGLETEYVKLNNNWTEKKASFVTLTINGNLRGCIGSLQPVRPFIEDLKDNAKSAAFKDPRFPGLVKSELDDVIIEISVLSELKSIKFKTEEDILEQLVQNEMGLVLEFGLYRGTFLPQVWDHYTTKKDFFNYLKMKAGLSETFFNKDMKVYYYTVDKIKE